MANKDPIFIGTPRFSGVKLTGAAVDDDGVGSTEVFQAGANGSRVHAIQVVPTGALASDIVLRLFFYDGSTYFLLGELLLASYTEQVGVAAPSYSMLDSTVLGFLDPSDQSILMPPLTKLFISALGDPVNALHITVYGGDY